MSSLKTPRKKTEKSKLLTMDTESEYTESTLLPPAFGCCHFMTMKQNKKPMIFILTLIFLAGAATVTILVLDHQGFWDDPPPIDQDWFKETLTNTTNPRGLWPLWLKAANPIIYDQDKVIYDENTSVPYLYRSQYGQLWTTDDFGYNYSTLTTQCRLIYNFATAYFVTQNISYQIAMKNGINVLLNRFNDNENGGFYYSINETVYNGNSTTIIDDTKDSVGHAAVLHALSIAWLITDNSDGASKDLYVNVLNKTFDLFEQYFIDEEGGIYMNLTADWQELNEIKSQVPLMNYFEALTPLYRVSKLIRYVPQNKLLKMSVIENVVTSLYEFVIEILRPYAAQPIQNNYLVLFEEYNSNWSQPLSESYASLGNAMKWSYLISNFIDQGIPLSAGRASNFFNYALYFGYAEYDNPPIAKMHNIIDQPDSSINAPYWTICNTIKSMYYYWDNGINQQDTTDQILDKLQNIIQYYDEYYYDSQYGGIYHNKPSNLWKGNISKVDYECIDMSLFVADIDIIMG